LQRYRRAKAAALRLHAVARGFTARCWYKAFVQRCRGGYSRADGARRRQRQQSRPNQGGGVVGNGIDNYGGSAVVILAPRNVPIPPRLWTPVLQVIQ